MHTRSLGLAALLATSPIAHADMASALAAVEAEQTVLDAAWLNDSPSAPSLLAGVRDDGSRRDGYADYLCIVLADHGVRDAIIRVMDAFAPRDNPWRELGKAVCTP